MPKHYKLYLIYHDLDETLNYNVKLEKSNFHKLQTILMSYSNRLILQHSLLIASFYINSNALASLRVSQ
jgi:hypothetical protein